MIKLLPDNDKQQRVRTLRLLQAMGGGVIQAIAALLLFLAGGFRLSTSGFVLLMGVLWTIHMAFYSVVRSGLSRRFSDPSLTQAQVIWAIICTLTILFFMAKFRFLLLPFLLLALIFGAFKMTSQQYFATALFTMAGYGAVIAATYILYPRAIHPEQEIMGGAVFALTILAFSFVGNEISRLRLSLYRKNADLEKFMKQLEQMASTDELTGLVNRREMMFLLNRQKALADREKTCFCICFFDIDHFKNINHTYGHQNGDIVLKRLAHEILKVTRQADVFARFGGEEFLLLACGIGMNETALAADRIRQIVATTDFKDISPDMTVTVSAGIARFRPEETIPSLLTRADKALYLAKESGRNGVKLESDL